MIPSSVNANLFIPLLVASSLLFVRFLFFRSHTLPNISRIAMPVIITHLESMKNDADHHLNGSSVAEVQLYSIS